MPDSSRPLADTLRDEIARRGPIPFRDFMDAALYHPEAGYYTSGRARIGREGDFFTNVSVGALFGKLLARQFAEMWDRLGKPSEFTIVEQGANQADFARDALAALQEMGPECFAATVYRIVEPSPILQTRQADALSSFSGKVFWHTSLQELPAFSGVHFSNELIDALPVHRVARTGSEWAEQFVDFRENGFVFVNRPISCEALADRLSLLPAVPEGYKTEVNLAALEWIATLSAPLRRGFVLAFDYGFSREEYYRPERTDGTLSAYASHHRERDPLARPGEIDLTAHVDFTSLAERAEDAGFHACGFTDQHHFMVGLGKLHFTDGMTAPKELRAFKTLMHPDLLGRGFKVFCLEKDAHQDVPLSGFQFGKDPRSALDL